ncbi:MAG: hypothetical protein CL489_05955 [Acidobacteria bacterium]|nr:hypothetical protein [Acidobacteriota bacterium]
MVEETEVKSQFALDAEGVEPSELDRITKGIQEYKIGLTPNALQIANAMLESQLKNGLFKLSELEAVVQIRNEIAEGMGEYQTQVQNAQRRIQQLSEEDAANRQATLTARDEAAKSRLLNERQLRKDAEERVSNLEAILASHGIHEYLDLSEESFDTKETMEEIAEEEEKKAEVVTDTTQVVTDTTPKKPSKAFELARALNPAPIADAPIAEETHTFEKPPPPSPSEILQDQLEPIILVDELDKQIAAMEDEGGPVQVPDLHKEDYGADLVKWEEPSITEEEETEEEEVTDEEVSQTDLFYQEVDKIEASSQVEEMPPTTLGSVTAQPVVTNAQLPLDIQDESDEIEYEKHILEGGTPVTSGDTIVAPVVEKISLGKVKLIPEGTGVQEEVDEIEIPNRVDLEKLTKAKIRDEADKLGFDVNTNQTKALMIDSFEEQTNQFIADLQDSGEFVSATETGDDDDDDRRDGGYF